MLWLAVRIVDAANHDRDTGDGVKVGGHQASSASLVSVMTALWFAHLDAADRVARQAARVAGVPRDPVPARRPRPVVPDDAARPRRPAVLPEPHQGPRPGRLLHRLGRARRGRAAVRARSPAATSTRTSARGTRSRFVALHRRRRARRGQHLGGDRRPGHPGPRQRHVGRRLQPPVAGPRRARHADRPVARPVRGGRLARRRGEVRRAAATRRSPSPGARRCATWIDEMPNEQYQALFGLAGDDAAQAVPRRRAGTTSPTFVPTARTTTTLAAAGRRPRRARPRRPARRLRASATP